MNTAGLLRDLFFFLLTILHRIHWWDKLDYFYKPLYRRKLLIFFCLEIKRQTDIFYFVRVCISEITYYDGSCFYLFYQWAILIFFFLPFFCGKVKRLHQDLPYCYPHVPVLNMELFYRKLRFFLFFLRILPLTFLEVSFYCEELHFDQNCFSVLSSVFVSDSVTRLSAQVSPFSRHGVWIRIRS